MQKELENVDSHMKTYRKTDLPSDAIVLSFQGFNAQNLDVINACLEDMFKFNREREEASNELNDQGSA